MCWATTPELPGCCAASCVLLHKQRNAARHDPPKCRANTRNHYTAQRNEEGDQGRFAVTLITQSHRQAIADGAEQCQPRDGNHQLLGKRRQQTRNYGAKDADKYI